MEDNSSTTEQSNETEVVVNSHDKNTDVNPEDDFNEPTSTVGSDEDIVSSTDGTGDVQDGSRSATEDKSLEEKPPSPSRKYKHINRKFFIFASYYLFIYLVRPLNFPQGL